MSATYFGRKTEHRKLMEREAAEQARDDREAINEGGDMSDLFLGKKTDHRRHFETKEAVDDRDYQNELRDSNRPLVDRLRDSQPKGTTGGYLLNDAADRILQLETELKRKDEDNTSLLADAISTIDKQRAELKRKDEALREIENLSRNHNLSSEPQYMIFDKIADNAREAMRHQSEITTGGVCSCSCADAKTLDAV